MAVKGLKAIFISARVFCSTGNPLSAGAPAREACFLLEGASSGAAFAAHRNSRTWDAEAAEWEPPNETRVKEASEHFQTCPLRPFQVVSCLAQDLILKSHVNLNA